MRHVVLAAAALLAGTTLAHSTDLPAKAPVMPLKAPVPVTTYDWSGPYLGAYWGTAVAQSRATTSAFPGTAEINDDGLAGGLTAGWNWQMSPHMLIGIEADIGLLDTRRSFREFNDSVIAGAKTKDLATVRARLGYVTGPSLIYLTGGAAELRVQDIWGTLSTPTTRTFSDWGYTVGGGIETKISRSWSATTEYLYVNGGGTDTFASNGFGANASFRNQIHIIKTGLNYKLDGGPFDGMPFFRAPLTSPQRWAGFYAGVNAGGGLSVVHLPNSFYGTQENQLDVNGTGFAGGVQAGYTVLLFSNWLAGLEGDFNYLGIKHSYVDWNNTGAAGLLVMPSLKTSWYGTARARFGAATGPAFLYVTGGAAFVDVTNSINAFGTPASVKKTQSGWTIGGGVETELDARWSARLEYLLIDVGTQRVTGPNGFSDFDNRFQVVRAGLSYKLGN